MEPSCDNFDCGESSQTMNETGITHNVVRTGLIESRETARLKNLIESCLV